MNTLVNRPYLARRWYKPVDFLRTKLHRDMKKSLPKKHAV